MITMDTDRLVNDYLGRLDAAAAHLQRSRRVELVAEIREHIEAALREEDAANEAAVRNVLERLGPPEEIVEAAEPAPSAQAQAGKLEIAALVALVLPLLGWLVGAVLVIASGVWSRRDKVVGLTLLALLVALPFFGTIFEAESGTVESVPPPGDPPVDTTGDSTRDAFEILLYAVVFLAGLPSALYLGWRLRRPESQRG